MAGCVGWQARMNMLGPGFFPLHQLGGAGLAAADLPPGATPGRNLLKYGLRPAAHAGLDAREARPANTCSSTLLLLYFFIYLGWN